MDVIDLAERPGLWQRSAACRDCPPDLFFPVGSTGVSADEIAMAKIVCHGCAVRSECLEYALRTSQEFGIWGGTDEDERRVLRKRSRRERPAALL